MRSRAYIIIGISALLFASCGRQHKAESLAKDFVAENMENPSAISGKDFADIGTTRHLNDSLITVIAPISMRMSLISPTDGLLAIPDVASLPPHSMPI